MIKTCSKCRIAKEKSEFSRDKYSKDLRCSWCKKCRAEYYTQYTKQDGMKQKLRKMAIERYWRNPQKMREQNEQYRQANKDKIKEKRKQYCQINKEKMREKRKQYYQIHKERENKKYKLYRLKNLEYERERNKQYYRLHREQEREHDNKYKKERYQKDPTFKLRRLVSLEIRQAIKSRGGSKRGPAWKHLPYTPQQLREHLESQFEPWMTWKNYGVYRVGGERKWNIDHIIPQSALPYDSEEDENFKRCWTLENLKPLEAIENIRKSNKLPTGDNKNDN